MYYLNEIKTVEDVKKAIEDIEFETITLYKQRGEEKFYKKSEIGQKELEEILDLILNKDYVIIPF